MISLNITKRKFLQLEEKQRHKKCAELLRVIYISLHQKKVCPQEMDAYNTLLSFMKESSFSFSSLKLIADQYHIHLKLAQKSLKEHNLLPHIRKGDHEPKADFLEVSIYLDNVRSAYNVGNILRTMEALRVGSLHTAKNTPFIDQDKVRHTAMGASSIVPCFQGTPLSSLPKPWIALETSDDAIPVSEFIFPESFTLILGNEEYGISDEVLEQVDMLVEVPLLGVKNSINIGSAFAIAAARIRDSLCPF